MKKKMLVFTHYDFDGMGIAVLSKLVGQELGLDTIIHYCRYSNIDKEISKALKIYKPEEISRIIIGDISPRKVTAKKLDFLYNQGVGVELFDHHKTALWLNRYPWAYVSLNFKHRGTSATELFYENCSFSLKKVFNRHRSRSAIEVFVTLVSLYDSYEWKEKGIEEAYNLNLFFESQGKRRFLDFMLTQILLLRQECCEISAFEKPYFVRETVEEEKQKIQNLVESVGNLPFRGEFTIDGKPVYAGFVFLKVPIYQVTAVSNLLLEKFPEIDYIVNHDEDKNRTDFRARGGDKKQVLLKFAKEINLHAVGHNRSAYIQR